MGLPRTFVSFSSTDLHMYNIMCAWKKNKHIDFNFADCQLEVALRSEDEAYIKRKCRERIDMAGTFALLIGDDTRHKFKYVGWEIEVALEKECRIIGVNLDGSRKMNPNSCPAAMRDIGAVFVPCRARILAHALDNFTKQDHGDWSYGDAMYTKLGYEAQ